MPSFLSTKCQHTHPEIELRLSHSYLLNHIFVALAHTHFEIVCLLSEHFYIIVGNALHQTPIGCERSLV